MSQLRIDDTVLACVVGGAVPLELARVSRASRPGNSKKQHVIEVGPNMPDEIEAQTSGAAGQGATGLQQL